MFNPPPQRQRGTALSGVVATAVAIGITELGNGLFTGVPSLVVSTADRIIDWAPAAGVRAAIAILGTNDKPVLVAAIVLLLLGAGARGARLVARRAWAGPAGFAAGGAAGLLAASGERGVAIGPVALTTTIAAGAGALALRVLLQASARSAGADGGERGIRYVQARRDFLGLMGGLAIIAVATAAGGRILVNRVATAARALVRLPAPARPAPPIPAGTSLAVDGITPVISPNDTFYRIDTAIDAPQLDAGEWSMRLTGMVQRPFTLSYAELLAMPMTEEDVTLTCVSNEVGGNLAGTARWLGVPVRDLLARAEVRPGAGQIIGRSVDGFTVGLPTDAVHDGRVALIAVGMNGVPLPFEHGYPARLVVAGLYGYVSATKWLTELELTTFQAFDSFWVERGWAKIAPIKTASRIDVPRNGQSVRAGTVPIAGVAWAQTRGISRVDVRVDDGPWREATLAEPIGVNCWRQWTFHWNAAAGSHAIAVRATDGDGHAQTGVVRPPFPDGATGFHTIAVDVGL